MHSIWIITYHSETITYLEESRRNFKLMNACGNVNYKDRYALLIRLDTLQTYSQWRNTGGGLYGYTNTKLHAEIAMNNWALPIWIWLYK